MSPRHYTEEQKAAMQGRSKQRKLNIELYALYSVITNQPVKHFKKTSATPAKSGTKKRPYIISCHEAAQAAWANFVTQAPATRDQKRSKLFVKFAAFLKTIGDARAALGVAALAPSVIAILGQPTPEGTAKSKPAERPKAPTKPKLVVSDKPHGTVGHFMRFPMTDQTITYEAGDTLALKDKNGKVIASHSARKVPSDKSPEWVWSYWGESFLKEEPDHKYDQLLRDITGIDPEDGGCDEPVACSPEAHPRIKTIWAEVVSGVRAFLDDIPVPAVNALALRAGHSFAAAHAEYIREALVWNEAEQKFELNNAPRQEGAQRGVKYVPPAPKSPAPRPSAPPVKRVVMVKCKKLVREQNYADPAWVAWEEAVKTWANTGCKGEAPTHPEEQYVEREIEVEEPEAWDRADDK
jgi:hypothetical protein